MFYVYIIKSVVDGKTYTGFTGDLKQRLEDHNAGKTKSIRHNRPYELVYYEAYLSQELALKREKHLKSSRFEKEKLFSRIFAD